MTGELPEFEPDRITITSLDYVLDQYVTVVDSDVLDALRARLIAREENVKTVLSLAGRQFGWGDEVVAEVLAQVGLGEPMDAATRQLVRNRYLDAVNRQTRRRDSQ